MQKLKKAEDISFPVITGNNVSVTKVTGFDIAVVLLTGYLTQRIDMWLEFTCQLFEEVWNQREQF